MSESSVRIAVCIADQVARNTACSMFSVAGARMQVCADASAIEAVLEDVHAVLLGLNAAPDQTLDALAVLRKRSATIPIFAIADTEGERHAKRAKKFGATEVIANSALKRRAGQLVRQVAQANNIEDRPVRAQGWTPNHATDGYDVESMDLGAWLATPGNRRLLGLPSEETPEPAEGPPPVEPMRRPDIERAQVALDAPIAARARQEAAVPISLPPRTEARPQRREETSLCVESDCPRLALFREQYAAQNAAILEAHQQREKRLLAELRNELLQAVSQQIAASETKAFGKLDGRVAEVWKGMATTIRRLQIVSGALGAALVAMAVAMAWRW